MNVTKLNEELKKVLCENYIVEFNYEDEKAQGQARGQIQVNADNEEEAIKKAKEYNEKHMFIADNYRVNPQGTRYENDIILESQQENLDVQALKEYLDKEHSRALKLAYNDEFTESDRSFYKGMATGIHEIQRKFNL